MALRDKILAAIYAAPMRPTALYLGKLTYDDLVTELSPFLTTVSSQGCSRSYFNGLPVFIVEDAHYIGVGL